MTGVYAEWQPRYAERGLATFPVRPDKVPAVKGYLKIGADVSRQLAIKFPANDAFGLACRRNRITVLDVDTPDEKMLADALNRHGPTPFIVRSGSGNFQAWYRRNGEGRRVRPDPGLPIDILGDGFVVCPPSKAAKGAYSIIQGSLDDLDRLPTMRAILTPEEPVRPDAETPARDGDGRNDILWRYCMKAARQCSRIEDLMEKAMTHNQSAFYEPLPPEEVLKIIASAWGYEAKGENWYGHGARVVFDADEVDSLASQEPRAFALLSILRRYHWGRDFALSIELANKLDWAPNTLRAARDILVQRKLIECVHPGGRGQGDPPIYRFP